MTVFIKFSSFDEPVTITNVDCISINPNGYMMFTEEKNDFVEDDEE